MSVYPLVSWLVTVPAFTIDVAVVGGSSPGTETLNVAAGDYWGWKTSGAIADRAASDSLPGVIEAAILTHTGIGAAFTSFTRSALIAGYTIAPTIVTSVQITATSNAAALALFGLAVNDFIRQASANLLISTRTAGVWRPYDIGNPRCEPVYTAVGSGAWSPYDASTNDRIRVGGALGWVVDWPFVNAADITREINGLADYLPLAGREAGDTNGTLDDLIEAAANGRQLLLGLPPIGSAIVDFRTCIIPRNAGLSRDEFTTEASIGSRRYNVSIPLLEARDYTP